MATHPQFRLTYINQIAVGYAAYTMALAILLYIAAVQHI